MVEECMLTMDGKSESVQFKAQRIYVSDQVHRFCLTGGSKTMMLEKRLLQKKNCWKVTSMNFETDKADMQSGERLSGLFEKLEEVFFGKVRATYRAPHERSSR